MRDGGGVFYPFFFVLFNMMYSFYVIFFFSSF